LGENSKRRLLTASIDRGQDTGSEFWIPDRDSLGNPIDPSLIEAAHSLWQRTRLVVLRYLGEDTEGAEILESAVDSASRIINDRTAIQSLERYLVRSVTRESIRRLRKQRRIEYMDDSAIERLAGAATHDEEHRLDSAKRFELFRACLDERGREMFDLRVVGFRWRQIAKLTRYADGHSARVQFDRHVERAMKRFKAHQDLRLKRPSGESDRSKDSDDRI
jgi:DNA-directed RNA polymerase specialized sigma24 family protein